MRAGDLDRKIVIQEPTPSQSGTGDVTQTWGAFATVWAAVSETKGRELFSSEHRNAERAAAFKIRWLSGVLPTMRISYDGAFWDIHSITEIGRSEGLEIMAAARV